MSNYFKKLKVSQIEALLQEACNLTVFRQGELVFVRLLHRNGLVAQATGENISVALKRINSYIGNTFTMPDLHAEPASKLDSLILKKDASLTIIAYKNIFSGKITSYDEHLLAIRNGNSIGDTLSELESASIQYGL